MLMASACSIVLPKLCPSLPISALSDVRMQPATGESVWQGSGAGD